MPSPLQTRASARDLRSPPQFSQRPFPSVSLTFARRVRCGIVLWDISATLYPRPSRGVPGRAPSWPGDWLLVPNTIHHARRSFQASASTPALRHVGLELCQCMHTLREPVKFAAGRLKGCLCVLDLGDTIDLHSARPLDSDLLPRTAGPLAPPPTQRPSYQSFDIPNIIPPKMPGVAIPDTSLGLPPGELAILRQHHSVALGAAAAARSTAGSQYSYVTILLRTGTPIACVVS